MEQFVKNVPKDKGKQASEIGKVANGSIRYLNSNKIIKPKGKVSRRDHNFLWVQGENWSSVVKNLDKLK